MASDILFTKQMRKATRDVHDLSDKLVNAKLAFAMSDNKIWAEGLLVFYEVFKYLEENVSTDILPLVFHRQEAFEKDLDYFLGEEWRGTYTPNAVVMNYIKHLESLKETKPQLLIAYVYHLYMGLLSGGQILQKKRAIANSLNILSPTRDGTAEPKGTEVTHFYGIPIYDLKVQMRERINEMAKGFDDSLKNELIEESKIVFQLNNTIIRTVRGTNQATIKKIVKFTVIVGVLYFGYRILCTKLF